MIRHLILTTAIVGTAGTLGAQSGAKPSADRARELDSYVAKAVRDWRAAGLAVAVVKDGQLVFGKGYGVRELGKPDAVDTATLFAIGSTTKAMTAAALAMLVDDGKVRWDDPVTKHLPGFQLFDPYVTREITVRDLVTHRAGLGNADFLWYGNDNSTAEVVRRARWIRPAYSLRSGFIYQNVMYAVAGEVVAAASGMPWEAFVRTRIFEPLGMRRSVTTLAKTAGVPNVAAPHYIIDDTNRVIRNASVDAVAAAGSIWSSVADMSKWMRFMLDSGRVDGKRLLQPATFAELLKPQTLVPPGGFYPTAQLTRPHWMTYALGWFQHDYDGRAVSFHTGSIDGMVAIIGLIPDERLGVYVLANTDHVEVRHALMYKAFDLWGARGTAGRDWSAELLKLFGDIRAQGEAARQRAAAGRISGTRPSLAMEKYSGTYADSLYGRVTVSNDNGTLRLRSGVRDAVLEHWQYDTFRVQWSSRWSGTSTATFTIGSSGVPSRLEIGNASYGRVYGTSTAQ